MNFYFKIKAFALMSLLSIASMYAKEIVFERNKSVNVNYSISEDIVVKNALDIFGKDFEKVFDAPIILNGRNAKLFVGTLGTKSVAERLLSKQDIEWLKARHEGFVLQYKAGKLIVVGSEPRGTAFGILEISRMLDVSPWEWWADVPVDKKQNFMLHDGYITRQSPSVKYRGIFLNDEDWCLMPWSSKVYEPTEVKGQIGPKTHARIFELLLRLRANTLWPAMHDCSVAFYFTPGNLETARKYGIYIGTSHCEPMLRNTNAEWNSKERGEYNFLTNKKGIISFWEERLLELKGDVNLFTLGLRGEHDFPMRGASTTEERKVVLDSVIKVQRELIAKYINKDVTKVPQVLIPYKEVLDIYRAGLQVPDDVTLMWTDDNYGYLKHFPDSVERLRKGGHGVYNHVSYWGRPHDYLWLSTNHPGLVYTQMKLAYDKGVKQYWVLNVGDIKPAEYQTELFMDMAWNIDGIDDNIAGLQNHLYNWISSKFGSILAKDILEVKNEYYRLAYIRKPEWMGATREEERDPIYRVVKDLAWTADEVNLRLQQYDELVAKINKITPMIPLNQYTAWYQLFEYPVLASAAMNRKTLYGQLARHGMADWAQSHAAYDEIVWLTGKYNALENGKWNMMMDYKPRNLPVFAKLKEIKAVDSLVVRPNHLAKFNGLEFFEVIGLQPNNHGLGYEAKAISLPQGTTVSYSFKSSAVDSVVVELALAPTHPVNGKTLRYQITVNDDAPQVVDYAVFGRTEEFKLNILNNQAIRRTKHAVAKNTANELVISVKAVDEGIVLDQISVYNSKGVKFPDRR